MVIEVFQMVGWDKEGQFIMDLIEERTKELLSILLLEGTEHPVLQGCAD